MSKQVSSSGLGLGSILFIIFLVLKLTNNINWSWWWVFSPLWIPAAFILFALGIGALIVGIRTLTKL